MQLSRHCATLQRCNRQGTGRRALHIEQHSCSLALSRRGLARPRTRMTVTVSLREAPRCGNTCDIPMATRYIRADRSTHDRCQDRPASETIFGFGPGGTRIAMLRVAYNERASKWHCAYERTQVARLFLRVFGFLVWKLCCTINLSIIILPI